uniref:Uncharacterized protein n=1 Tax=Aegilops tauschii subsp. strangulata TaxID=200361 RepID=A0A453F2G7_AEGTS
MPPRRRDRRSHRDPSPSPSRPSGPRASPSSPRLRLAFIVPPLLLLVLTVLHFTGLLSRSPPYPQTPGKTPLSVYDRGLVKRQVSAGEILAVRASSRSVQSFQLRVHRH